MNRYKIVFQSGVTETIEVGKLVLNEHIGRIEIKDQDGEDMEGYYLDYDRIAAIIPQ